MVLPILARRCIISTLRRQCSGSVRLQTGSISAARFTPPVSQNATCGILRSFSSTPSQPTTTTPPPTTNSLQPPTSLTPEAGLGAQDAMKLFIQHVSFLYQAVLQWYPLLKISSHIMIWLLLQRKIISYHLWTCAPCYINIFCSSNTLFYLFISLIRVLVNKSYNKLQQKKLVTIHH